MTYTAQFKVGDHVEARHSGKIYIVLEVWPTDECGSFAVGVRGWRGGRLYGPSRRLAESSFRLATKIPGTSP